MCYGKVCGVCVIVRSLVYVLWEGLLVVMDRTHAYRCDMERNPTSETLNRESITGLLCL